MSTSEAFEDFSWICLFNSTAECIFRMVSVCKIDGLRVCTFAENVYWLLALTWEGLSSEISRDLTLLRLERSNMIWGYVFNKQTTQLLKKFNVFSSVNIKINSVYQARGGGWKKGWKIFQDRFWRKVFFSHLAIFNI
jgi:hypothetical protein